MEWMQSKMFSTVKDKVMLVASIVEGLEESRARELEKRLVEPEYQPENDESSVGRSMQTLFMQLSDIGDSVRVHLIPSWVFYLF